MNAHQYSAYLDRLNWSDSDLADVLEFWGNVRPNASTLWRWRNGIVAIPASLAALLNILDDAADILNQAARNSHAENSPQSFADTVRKTAAAHKWLVNGDAFAEKSGTRRPR